jgi:ribosomal protein S18 acetylase RimI-like enzyme
VNKPVQTLQASLEHLDDLVPLFDAYRVFYQQSSDLDAARAYLQARLERDECTVFLAYDQTRAVGFALLYATFTSVALKPLVILNDLYVIPEARGSRIGERLIERGAAHARLVGAAFLRLRTAQDNLSGQKLYERAGFVRDEVFLTYYLKLEEQK